MCADRKKERSAEIRLVRDVAAKHSRREVPVARASTPIVKMAEAIEWYRHSRQLYVVDETGRLLGNITLARLVMYTFAHSQGANMAPRHVLDLITCETAADLMETGTLAAGMDDNLDDLLDRMVDRNLEEVPVLDDEGKVISDLTMIDLLRALS
ncbi:MAG: CBS domain-containing protein [bacterium]|nr:CBS domain-containing protein [bacterium]MDT8395409.1 CBS domain-containing protein [bacterium]